MISSSAAQLSDIKGCWSILQNLTWPAHRCQVGQANRIRDLQENTYQASAWKQFQ